MKAIVSNMVYVPYSELLKERAVSLYEVRSYNERACSYCDYAEDKHSEMCDECPAFLAHFKLWKQKGKNGKEYLAVPKGDTKRLAVFLRGEDVEVIDRRAAPPMKQKIAFTGNLQEAQKSAIRQLDRNKNNGVLKAPPRSGKTVMATYKICQLGLKTLVLASQADFLQGFYDTFMGNTTQAAMTDAGDFLGSVGFCKSLKDFDTYDVCLATYQSLGVKDNLHTKTAELAGKFGLVIIDECHDVAAKIFSRVVSTLKAKHVIGLSGTPDRKDGAYPVAEMLIGRVTAEIQVETAVPTVRLVETGVRSRTDYKLWTYAMRFLHNHEERNKLIARHAAEDIRAGHSIVIPTSSIKHCDELVRLINEHFDEPVAVAFTGRLKAAERARLLEDARNYKVKAVVGIRKIVQVGINVPRWSCLYEVEPISNPPKAEQETSRIRTKMDGKPDPLIKIFVEYFPQTVGPLRTLWFKTVLPKKFKVSKDTAALAMRYISRKKGRASITFREAGIV